MKTILLTPKRGVTASIGAHALAAPVDTSAIEINPLPPQTLVFSFQSLSGAELTYLPYDACTRIKLTDDERHVIVVAAQSASSYADLLLWDLAHEIPVGGTLTIIEPFDFVDCILTRAYFEGVFDSQTIRVNGWTRTQFTKLNETLSETESGLGAWTFGLPVGEANQVLVDRLTAHIAQLGLDDWQLLLAVSKESAKGALNLPDHIGIIHCPASTITDKKNRLAEAARHPNLCLFHDRVELPHNFKDAVLRFGDHYAICGFQQLLFDTARDSLERYSDYHVDLGDGNLLIGVEGPQGNSSIYVRSLETRLGFRTRFAEAHPAEYDRRNYVTGSLYLVKRSVWRLIGQHPEIEWNELEDVEFGERSLNTFGVPSRLNPYAFGFTSRVRAVLVGHHEVADRKGGGSVVEVISSYRTGPVSTKGTGLNPLQVRQRAWELFEDFGIPEHNLEMRVHIFTAPLSMQCHYAHYWVRLLYSLALPRRESRVKQFLLMYSVAAYGFAFDPGTLSALTSNICSGGFFVDCIIRDNYFVRALANAPNLLNSAPETANDILLEQVMRLWRRGGDYVYSYDNFEELWLTIRDSLRSSSAS